MKNILFIFIFILSSCYVAPKAIYLLEPTNSDNIWFFGKQYLIGNQNDIKIAFAYDKTINDKYLFKIEIINLSNKPVLISPEKFYYISNFNNLSDTIYAIDPEEEILRINKTKSKEDASYISMKNSQSLISFIDLIVDVAEIGKEKSCEEKLAQKNDYLEQEISDLKTDFNYQSTINSLNRYKSTWEQTALRKTTLPSGFKITGDIYFPVNQKAERMDFYIVIEKSEVKFSFKQILEQAN